MNPRRRSPTAFTNQIGELVTPAGAATSIGQVTLRWPVSGGTGWREQARGGQPFPHPQRLIIGQLGVGGGIEHPREELIHAAAALFGGTAHPREKFVCGTPGQLAHACMMAGMTASLI